MMRCLISPTDLKEVYKTVGEIKQRIIVDMAADRGIYIDQSQSLNIHMVDATTAKLSSMHGLAAGPQDGHVLPADESGRGRHQVHGGGGQGAAGRRPGPGRREAGDRAAEGRRAEGDVLELQRMTAASTLQGLVVLGLASSRTGE